MTGKDGDRRYAQRIISRPGLKDGLYWPAINGQPASPLSKMVDRAVADGYKPRPSSAYFGYRFKVIAKQGPKVAGSIRTRRGAGFRPPAENDPNIRFR